MKPKTFYQGTTKQQVEARIRAENVESGQGKPTRDETKLPKWAQDEMRVLRMRAEEADARARGALGEGTTRAAMVGGGSYDEGYPLPQDRITFDLNAEPTAHLYDGSKVRVRPEKDNHDRWYLEIMGVGGGDMAVVPSSSNVVRVYFDHWPARQEPAKGAQ